MNANKANRIAELVNTRNNLQSKTKERVKNEQRNAPN